jgi:hypothetical protein
MIKLHTYQEVSSGIHRIAVPGGWLYVMSNSRSNSSTNWGYGYGYGHMVFVPDPTVILDTNQMEGEEII